MDKRKIIKICIIVFCVFFGAALVESLIRSTSSGINKFVDNIKENKKQEEIYNSDESKTERQIENFINVICDAISDKDYEYVYNSLDETYRDYKFHNNKNEMITFVENNLISSDSYQVLKIEKKAGLYQTLVRYSVDNMFESRYFTVDVINENEYKIMFDEIVSIGRSNIKSGTQNVDYSLKYTYESTGIYVFVVEILNKAQEDLNIKFEDILATSADGEIKHGITVQKDLYLKAGESKTEEFIFSNSIGVIDIFEIKGTENEQEFNLKMFFENGL